MHGDDVIRHFPICEEKFSDHRLTVFGKLSTRFLRTIQTKHSVDSLINK